MADFNVRSDAVDVEQIMRQIRARIREKRGADYTEQELQQLATVKLEKFLDPRGVRSDLVNQFKRHRTVSPEPPKYEFEDTTLYDTHRGALRFMRKLLHPILKLFINPNPLIHALHVQKQVNDEFHKRFRQREEMDPLYYEVVHNLVMEITRLGIDVHNLKMRVESLSSRMDFDERRARSLESVVQYRQPARPSPPQQTPPNGPRGQSGQGGQRAARSAGASRSRRRGPAWPRQPDLRRQRRQPPRATPPIRWSRRRRPMAARWRLRLVRAPTTSGESGGAGAGAGPGRTWRIRRMPAARLRLARALPSSRAPSWHRASVPTMTRTTRTMTAMAAMAAAGTTRMAEPPISEARGRGSALRRGYQRRRRTSRSIHR